MWDWGYGSGWMFVLPVLWIGLLALIVWAVVSLVQRGRTPNRGEGRAEPRRDTPEEILDRRFARGEIEVDAYREARARLAEHRAGPE